MNKKHNRFRSHMPREQLDQLQGTEIKSTRTRFGKVFALGANHFQAVTYTAPVHRFNEKTREWDEMDNRFSATPRMKEAKAALKQGIMPAVAHGDVMLECKTGSMDVTCAMSGEAPFINLTDAEGRHLAWGIKDAMSILPEAGDINDTPAQNVRGMREKVLDHLHGEVAYNGIFAGVDLRCKLDRGFKDELVFAEKESVRPVTFLLESEGRQMELNDQNMLIVKDEQGAAVFRLLAPFMLDADEQRGEVAVQLEARKSGMYAMTYIPDAAFVETAAFPVVLDPAIESVRGETGIQDTYVKEGSSELFHENSEIWICDNSTYGKRYGYMRVNKLPKIGSNHFITSAFMNIRNCSAPTADTILLCSEVTGDWTYSNLTYATKPSQNSLYQDYCKFPAGQYGWQQLDVTSLARKWYHNDNKGIVLTPRADYPNVVRLHSSNSSYQPYLVVNYASLAGLESYLSYDAQSAGLAGQSYISLVNGNMFFSHSDTVMNGNRLPVSVSHYYNSCDSDKDEFYMGYGWRTSMHQTLHKELVNNEVVYVYTDGDGTEHWFELDDSATATQYKDMSGLSFTLTIASDGIITITDKGDSRMVFPAISGTPTAANPVTTKKLISSVYDAVGNQITISPLDDDTLRIASVTDGAGRETTFSYYTSGSNQGMCSMIQTKWQSTGACTRFDYSAKKLTDITHEDGRTASYTYATRNGYALLMKTSSVDGISAEYTYSNTGAIDGLPFCITQVVTKGTYNGATITASDVSYTYGNHMTLRTDNLSKGRTDHSKTLRYHFNDNGNEVSIDDELGYAVYTRYDQTDRNENAPINHATTRSRMQRVVKNLLTDSMFELNSSAWTKSATGTARDISTYKWGIVSYKLTASSSGSYISQQVSLKPGSSYTFSGYLRSGAEKTFLRVIYMMNGVAKYFDSDPAYVHANPSGKEFERVAVSFTLPENAAETVYCNVMCMGSSGNGWASCMQLEEGLTSNHFNMLQDQNYTSVSTNTSDTACWRVGNDTLSSKVSAKALSSCQVTPPSILTGRALHLDAHYNTNYNLCIEQEIKVSGYKGDRFTVGGWCSTFAKAHNEDAGVFCCIDVLFPMTEGWVRGGQAVFNYEEGNWQFACAGIKAPHNYTKILVRVNMSQQMNYADLTGLFLYPESFGTEYVYDTTGNPTEALQLFNGTTAAEYDDHNNLTKYTAPGQTLSSTFSYGTTEADQKMHLLRSSRSPLGTEGKYGYDSHGNNKRSDTSCAVDSLSAISRSTAEFQHNDNYIHKQTDARGKTVTSVIDADKGTTTSVTDPKNQTVTYTHDTLRRVTKVATVAGGKEYRNEYTYDQTRGMLTGVKHNVDNVAANDVSYNFEYDALGRKTRVLVGTTMLSTNVYQNDKNAANYGTLQQMQYGNGTVVKNSYDDFNRITGIRYNNETTPRYEYAYNANGQVAFVRNNQINHVTESEYDLSNRPCRVKTHKVITDTNGNVTSSEHIYTGEVAYDPDFGRLTKFTERVGNARTEYATEFGYDAENRPTSLAYGTYGQSTITYDGLGRVQKTTTKAGSGTTKTTQYTYVAGAALETSVPSSVTDAERKAAAQNAAGKTSTTGLVASITQTGGNFTYTYDDNGNITKVVQDGITTSYTYDALGQLTQVDDGQENATWVYKYDQGGNIESKKKYVLGVTSGTPVESKSFTYGNANWKDQLTAVDGVTITYDAIGNPLNDGTWQYEWVNGRQLARMYNVDTDASFIYNENGLRVQKTVNGVVTKYTLHGKNIVHMTQGSNELHFFYDAQNKPAVVVYNGTPYSYVKNLQGDIVGILNSAGSAVVNYVYDAWGRPISKTGSMASTLGTVQPFRYRGYVYDEETELYYLRSRYYVSHNCRFLNCDNMFGKNRLLAHNLFSYCRNKVVKVCDSNGCEEEDYTLADLGVEFFVLTKGEYYRVRPAVEGVRARNIETNSPVKIYTMCDDTENAIDYCARYTGSHFEFYYLDQIVSLSFDDVSHIDYGDEWAYYLGYNTETVVPNTHKPRATTWHTQLALNYATGMSISCDGTFCDDSWNATMAFQTELANRGVEITVDGWAGKDTKPWLLEPLLEALYDMEYNLPP